VSLFVANEADGNPCAFAFGMDGGVPGSDRNALARRAFADVEQTGA
jgi:hypothetical protein